MSTITTILGTDQQNNSRAVLNTNFDNLNTDKAEISGQTFTGQVDFSGTDHAGIKVNSLTTTQRDALTPANGMVIYNSTNSQIEVYQGSAWVSTIEVQYVTMTLGETVAVNDAVYVKASDGLVYQCDADDVTKIGFLGFAKVAGDLGESTTVQVLGVVTGLSSLTIGSSYYISGTAGEVTATAPTNAICVGRALTATTLLLDRSNNRITRKYVVGDSPATWTKSAGLKYVIVETQDGGQSGYNATGGTSPGAGGASSFGTLVKNDTGDVIIPGGPGMWGRANSTTGSWGGNGGDSVLGRGGKYVSSNAAGNPGTGYGGGGGGAAQTGGSYYGGAGGDAGTYSKKLLHADVLGATETVTIGAGGVATGATYNGGPGSAGVVLVTEFY